MTALGWYAVLLLAINAVPMLYLVACAILDRMELWTALAWRLTTAPKSAD